MKIATHTPIASNFKTPQNNNIPFDPKDPDDEPKDTMSAHPVLAAGLTVVNRTAESVLYNIVGGGTLGGSVQFGAIYEGVSGAIDGGTLAKHSGASNGKIAGAAAIGGAVGAGFGALRGWSNFVLTSACGGGLTGALVAGASIGSAEAVVNHFFHK